MKSYPLGDRSRGQRKGPVALICFDGEPKGWYIFCQFCMGGRITSYTNARRQFDRHLATKNHGKRVAEEVERAGERPVSVR